MVNLFNLALALSYTGFPSLEEVIEQEHVLLVPSRERERERERFKLYLV